MKHLHPKNPLISNGWRVVIVAEVIVASVIFATSGAYNIYLQSLGATSSQMSERWTNSAFYTLLAILGLIAIAAICRTSSTHPAGNISYLNWLKLTPWTPGHPLPLGNPLLRTADAVGLLFSCLLAILTTVMGIGITNLKLPFILVVVPSVVIAIAIFFYCIGLIGTLIRTDFRFSAAAIVIALAAIIRLLPNFWLVGLLLIGLLVFSQVLLAQGLHSFPWDHIPPKTPRAPDRVTRLLDPRPPNLVEERRSIENQILMATAGGAWIYVIAATMLRFDPQAFDPTRIWILATFAAVLYALARWARYTGEARGPLGWTARIKTGFYFFPRWDRMHLGPLLIILVGYFAPRLLPFLGISYTLAVGISFPLIATVATLCPPNIHTWRLTGGWSISPSRPWELPAKRQRV